MDFRYCCSRASCRDLIRDSDQRNYKLVILCIHSNTRFALWIGKFLYPHSRWLICPQNCPSLQQDRVKGSLLRDTVLDGKHEYGVWGDDRCFSPPPAFPSPLLYFCFVNFFIGLHIYCYFCKEHNMNNCVNRSLYHKYSDTS